MRLAPFLAALSGCELYSRISHGGYTNDCEWYEISDAYWTCGDIEYCENVRGEGMCFDLKGRRYNCDADADEVFRMACNVCQMSDEDRGFYCD